MSDAFLELDDYETAAQKILSKSSFDYFAGGADDEITLRQNRLAFAGLKLLPRVLKEPGADSTLTLFGLSLASPIIIAPTAFHCLAHPQGELATTRAARETKSLHIVSTASTVRMEDIAKEWPDEKALWFQLSVQRDWNITRELIFRAEAAGYRALVVSVDAPVFGRRLRGLRNQFSLPSPLRPENFFPPESPADRRADPFTYPERLTWKEINLIQATTKLPVLLKGILSPLDANLAVQNQIDGLIVSNHGGRQLDGVPATIQALGAITQTVEKKIPVLVDGGFRRGTDVLKALAMGAVAVAIGRPILWGLAVAGETGVSDVLNLLNEELVRAMRLCGVNSVQAVPPQLLQSAFARGESVSTKAESAEWPQT